MSLYCPACADWRWFGSLDPQQIAALGTRQSEPSTWIKHAYAWLYDRLDRSARADLPMPIAPASGPPRCLVPVLAVSPDGHGYLGFVFVGLKDHAKSVAGNELGHSMQQAAETVAAYFRRLVPDVGFPHLVPCLPRGAAGASGDLSAVLATLAILLHGQVADEVVATACVNGGRIDPVEPTMIPAKIALARRWGYRRLLVAEDQQGIPADAGMEICRLPQSLVHGFFAIVKAAIIGPTAESTAQLLAVFDQAAVRGEPRGHDLPLTLQTTKDFVRPPWPPLVRHVAHDIRSRALLHAGHTEDANSEKERAADCRPEALDMPDGWLGDYLKWQQPAHRSVVALDQARWDDRDPDHVLLDRTLERLLGAINDRQAGRTELIAALFLSNTRARRYDFLGRRLQDVSLLERAWIDLTRFAKQWPQLFAYFERIGMRDSTLRRQQNYCIELIGSYQALFGGLPASWIAGLETPWPDQPDTAVGSNPYDVVYQLRWNAVLGRTIPERRIEKALGFAQTGPGGAVAAYPWYLVFEAVLRHQLGTADQQERAAEGLARCCLFQPELDSASILTVLTLRAARLLELAGCPHPEPVAPQPGTALAELADDLRSQPDSIVARTPY